MLNLCEFIASYVTEPSCHQDIRDVAKSVNSSLTQLIKPEDAATADSLHNVTTPAAGNVTPMSLTFV